MGILFFLGDHVIWRSRLSSSVLIGTETNYTLCYGCYRNQGVFRFGTVRTVQAGLATERRYMLKLHATWVAGTKECPTLDTIESYMGKLHNIVLNSPQQHEAFIATAVDIISRLGNEG